MATVLLNSETLSTNKTLNLQFSLTLALTAEEARRLINRQVVPQLGTGLVAITPELLILDAHPFWRVPIKLSLPHWGDLGEVGTVMVDALTGKLQLTDKIQERIINHARWLYQGATLQTE